MAKVGSYEAKTHLPELIRRVEAGERITITRSGKDVALLVPVPGAQASTIAEAIEGLRAFRQEHTLGADLTVHDLIDEGRR